MFCFAEKSLRHMSFDSEENSIAILLVIMVLRARRGAVDPQRPTEMTGKIGPKTKSVMACRPDRVKVRARWDEEERRNRRRRRRWRR